MAAPVEKPSVLILGGVGFIGRHLTTLLVEEGLVSKVRVVDKVPPSTGWLNPQHKEVFAQVEFKQLNLANAASADKAFADGPFQIVYNLAAETKYGQSEQVYEERVLRVAMNCATVAAKAGSKFIHISTGQVYDSSKGVSTEESKVDPWTLLAKYHLRAELALKNIPELQYLIVRPAIVYGIGDRNGLTPRLVIAAVYRHLGEKMKLLWSEELRMNTVHVSDVSRGLWLLGTTGGGKGEVYNMVDAGETTQGVITQLVSELFAIKASYFGSILSNLAKLNMSGATEESNDKHLAPWSEACTQDSVSNTPLSPYLDQELLYNRHLHLDGGKLRTLGFDYRVPKPTLDLLREVVMDYVANGQFPPSLLP
ncbi:dTDP-D-glucose 4,6-dehydratase-like [Halichondria panicea]|uniref:dTDP-D-glucose 4,6-dehydratase-like n=1 Tax=Halichondria panicea TaxID=6063 RepID=UPI00312B5226